MLTAGACCKSRNESMYFLLRRCCCCWLRGKWRWCCYDEGPSTWRSQKFDSDQPCPGNTSRCGPGFHSAGVWLAFLCICQNTPQQQQLLQWRRPSPPVDHASCIIHHTHSASRNGTFCAALAVDSVLLCAVLPRPLVSLLDSCIGTTCYNSTLGLPTPPSRPSTETLRYTSGSIVLCDATY